MVEEEWPMQTFKHCISFIMCNIHHDKHMNESTIKTMNTK